MKSAITIFIGSLVTFLLPIQGLLLLIISVTLLDTIVGVYVAIKKEGRASFRSGKLFNLAPKLFFYVGTTLVLFLVDKYILQGALFNVSYLLSKSISMVWVYTELKSLDELSIKLGNKPFIAKAKELVSFIKKIKTDINEVQS
jgi:hypothetical protein